MGIFSWIFKKLQSMSHFFKYRFERAVDRFFPSKPLDINDIMTQTVRLEDTIVMATRQNPVVTIEMQTVVPKSTETPQPT
jgi:hypothetical protein